MGVGNEERPGLIKKILALSSLQADDSPVVQAALQAAKKFRAALTLLRVMDTRYLYREYFMPFSTLRRSREGLSRLLEKYVGRLFTPPKTATYQLEMMGGSPRQRLREQLEISNAELVVLGEQTSRRCGSWEGVWRTVIRDSRASLLLLKGELSTPLQRVMVARQGGLRSGYLLDLALGLAEKQPLRLLQVVEEGERLFAGGEVPDLGWDWSEPEECARSEVVQFLRQSRFAAGRFESRVVTGKTAEIVVGDVRRWRPELLLLEMPRLGGVEQFWWGSTVRRIVREISCPVLLANMPAQPQDQLLPGRFWGRERPGKRGLASSGKHLPHRPQQSRQYPIHCSPPRPFPPQQRKKSLQP